MTPQAFAADLATIPAMDDLTVRICSGGGDVWAAQAIGAMLENRLGTVTAQIEGICASAATIVASHCKVVKAAEDATYMIHPIKVNPNGFVDMEGLKQLMDALTVMRTNVLNQYAKKTGHTVEEVAAWMDATSWWTAAEAKENGFIDEITESNQTAKIENRNGALFVNSIAVPGTFDDAPEFVRNRAVVAPATTEGFVNNTDPAGKPDKNDGGNDMEFKNADELRNGCPDLVKEIVDEAHAEAQKQERDRLAAIDEIADEELDKLFAGKTFSGQGKNKPLNIFDFEFPTDFGNDEDVDTVAAAAPFILVKAAGWSIDKMEEPEMVDMSLIICTYQTPIRNKEEGVRDKKAPAVLDLYNIMQDIGQHFRVYNIFGDYFNVLLPIDCAIQQDDTSPYYFATVQMDVTCPSMSSENNPEIEELI